MRKTRFLLLLIFVLPAPCRAEPPVLDQLLLARVAGNALAFMAPRTLDAVPVPRMALWGLQGLTTMDPRLIPELPAGKMPGTLTLTLASGGGNPAPRLLLSRAAPADDDAAGWGDAIGQTVHAAWDASEAVRRGGTQRLISGFFDELFNHMDPYSRYAPPDQANADRLRRNGRAGVGLLPGASGGGFVVETVQAGGPAAQAGVRPGELILAVDGQGTQGADLRAVAALLGGVEHSHALLTLRGRDGRSRTVDLERIRVPPETVTSRWIGDMLVLRISSFSSNTASRLAQELIRGQTERRPSGVIIDLRGNRGGVLQQAVAAAAMLQPSGVMAVTAGRDPAAAHVFVADGRDLATPLPVVVLVDGASASAAEIFAASLADEHRAVVVGSATLGKGLVQTIAELPDGGELFVTWSRVLAPAGWPIQGLGVLPQVCTSLGPDILARQLRALVGGVQPMAEVLARHRAARAPLAPVAVLDMRAACPAAMGHDADLGAARFLIDTPPAYRAALLAAPAGPLMEPATAAEAPSRLTPKPVMSN